jgi:NDP-sugar pyrophosphorylase family protein
MAENYSEEMVQKAIAMYSELGNEGIPEIAKALEKSERSVRSKLVNVGVYVSSPKQPKKGETPSKKQLLNEIEAVGFDISGFQGATKEALTRLLNVLSN